MIHVTQGHEFGVGLEVFFKAWLQQSENNRSKFVLYSTVSAVEATLKNMRLQYDLSKDCITLGNKNLPLVRIKSSKDSQSLSALLTAIESNTKSQPIFTLPTSKDQLQYQSKTFLGYTEFFRHYFNEEKLGMFFHSNKLRVLLLSDHQPLTSVPNYLKGDFIEHKIDYCLERLNNMYDFKQVIILGINPHAGENGLLGREEQKFAPLLDRLKRKYKHISFNGPYPADGVWLSQNTSNSTLIVSMYHDQTLPLFKTLNGLLGINVTIGLPFLRISVDHGTAFDLYGKNMADERGAFYCQNFLCNYLEK